MTEQQNINPFAMPQPQNTSIAHESLGGSKRAYLTDADKTLLVKLCVEYQVDHRHWKKTAFWNMISELLLQEGGIKLKDPQGTVKGLMGARRAILRKQDKESGTVQEESELTQAIDKWIGYEDELERQNSRQKSPSVAEKEAREAAKQRLNLLVRRGRKRKMSQSESEDNDPLNYISSPSEDLPSISTFSPSESTTPLARSKKRRTVREESDISTNNTQLLVGAVDRLGESMILAASLGGSLGIDGNLRNSDSERLTRLEQRLDAQAEENKETQQTLKDMLTKILEKLN